MRLTVTVIALILISAFPPKTGISQSSSFSVHPAQTTEELSREERFFVNALFDRIDKLLAAEFEKYDAPYSDIKVREHKMKSELEQALKNSSDVEQRLEKKRGEEQELRKALNKAATAADKARIEEQFKRVESERKQTQIEVDNLNAKRGDLKEALQLHRAMYFAQSRDLKAQADRVTKQKNELFFKYGDWQTRPAFKTYIALRDHLMKTAATMALACNVTIRSERNSVETTGATIKYETVAQRKFGEPTESAKCTTRCSEPMEPNIYYVWTERENKPTSNRDRKVSIAGANVPLVLIEDR